MGAFTYAVSQMPPGKAYMAAGTTCTWPEFLDTWAKVNNVQASYKQVSPEEMIEATEDRETGIEVAAMYSYSSDPGYDGGMNLLTAIDLEKVSNAAYRPQPRLGLFLVFLLNISLCHSCVHCR